MGQALRNLFFAFALVGGAFAQSSARARVDHLLSAANPASPDQWARDLMEADAQAVYLEAKAPRGCCEFRCWKVHNFELTFIWSEIAGHEIYQHDLVKLVVRARQGTILGAQALTQLLQPGCGPLANPWAPYFQTVLGIVESRQWRTLNDLALTRIRAEAYETWWSLSKADPHEPALADNGFSPRDFERGANEARAQAITAYQSVVAADPRDQHSAEHLRALRAGEDTRQRAWFCSGD